LKNQNLIPPKVATKLLHAFLRTDLAEEVEGDLEEKFYSDIKNKTFLRARFSYWYEVLSYLRPFAIRKSKSHSNYYAMYSSYFKIGWRNLLKNKTYSVINISGLAIGMAVAILIGLWIFDELSFNKSFKNYDRLASVYFSVTFGGEAITDSGAPPAMAAELKSNHPEFDEVVIATYQNDQIISYEENVLSRPGLFADPSFIKLFSMNMVHGGEGALNELHSIVLSQKLANDLVGSDPIGKMIKYNHDQLMITGVFEDFPTNSEFGNVELLMPMDYYFKSQPTKNTDSWEDISYQCFVLLNDKTSIDEANLKIKDLLYEKGSDDMKSLKPKGFLFPAEKWHFHSGFKNEESTDGKVRFVWMFGIVGSFVLILACINFMNLSTARSERRSKEVGIRKVLGSVRRQLVNQFLSESLLMVLLAFSMSLLLVVLSLPWFNDLSDKHMVMPWSNPYFILTSLAFILLTSLLAGSYPALFLSAFNPVKVLKGTFKAGRFAALPRKAMVVFQFTISTALIIGTIVVFQQIQHAKDRPVGFDREGIFHLDVRTEDLAKADYNTLREELLSTGVVANMAKSDFPITGSMAADASLSWEGKDPANQPLVALNSCSHDFPKTNGFQFIEGRDFSREFSTDSSAVIVNELFAKLISTESVIGKKINFGYGKEKEIIGVIKDQIRWTPFSKQSPHLYYLSYKGKGYLTIKLNPEVAVHDALEKVEAVFKKHDPSAPFNYKFQDDDYARLFNDEERIGKIATVFAALTILISCLGIFGLAAFAASQRNKEIGIRKVLGATVFNVWKLLSRDFLLLVIISMLLSAPLAYYYSNQWLQQYNYRIEISWWVFVITSIVALMITLLTVSYQSIKAALINPVETLKSE
jgi:putative ABC transport system permease protein